MATRTYLVTLAVTVEEDGGTATEGLCDSIRDCFTSPDAAYSEPLCEDLVELIDAEDLGLCFGGLDVLSVTLQPEET